MSLYRIRQFWRALFVEAPSESEARTVASLPSPLRELFTSMDRADQRHCLDVYSLLISWGYNDEDLLQAALLHDVGKGLARIRLWQRVAVVLGEVFGHSIIDRLADARPHRGGYAFYVHRHHAELGAALVQTAGGRSRLVEMIRCHHTNSDDELAEALCRADGQC